MNETSQPGGTVPPGGLVPHVIHQDAIVYTADGHQVGKVVESLQHEFFVEEHHLLHSQTWSFTTAMVREATATRIDVTVSRDDLHATWNQVTLQDSHGRDRHVIQVGRPRVNVVPTYDEVQTTAGGPPTGEADDPSPAE